MEYENPQIPEGINTSSEHPLKGFAILLVSSLALLFVLAWLLAISGGWLATKIPFEKEVGIAQKFPVVASEDAGFIHAQAYLQTQVDEIAALMDLPEGMHLTVHYDDSDVVNAFATLGGNLVFYRGLLEMLPNENALSMLIAHEIAHVKHRHPIQSLGRGLSVSIGLSLVTGGVDSVDFLGNAGIYTILHFSRNMERQSDEEALFALQKRYGHVQGSKSLFEAIKQERNDEGVEEPVVFFSSHPLDDDRLAAIDTLALQYNLSLSGEITPLEDFLPKNIADSAEN